VVFKGAIPVGIVIEPTTDRGRRLLALSQRLRVLHSELADQNEEMRSEQLRDEIQRALAAIASGEREEFLVALMEQFPTWADGNALPAPVRAAPVAAAPAVEIKDPKILAEKLIENSKGLSDGDRLALAERLGAAGFAVIKFKEAPAVNQGGGLPAAQVNEFKKVVGMSADANVDPARLLETASLLAEFTLKLEPWACSYWRDLAPEAKNAIYQTLNKDLARFAGGDDKLTKEAMAKSVYKLRSLVSLLMKGVMEAGKQFARDHLGRYSLEAIGSSAAKGGAFKSQAVCNWEQYIKLMEGVDGPAIEKRLKQVIAKDVDTGLSQVIR
jgi:hypothetical protein